MIRLLNPKKINGLFAALFSTLISLTSCVDQNETIGLELIDSESGMNVLSSDADVSLKATVFKPDSLVTLNNGYYILGSYKDNNFGKFSASVYTTLSLPDVPADFNSLGEIDSVVLCLAYTGAFTKDSSIKQTTMQISVQELSEQIDSTKKYASDIVPVSGEYLFNSQVTVNPSQSVILGNEQEYNPHLRLKLSDAFVNKLKSRVYSSNDDFKEDFKGLKIQASTLNDDMVAYVNLSSDISGIKVYYHYGTSSFNVYSINFPIAGPSFMHIDYDYNSTALSILATDSLTVTGEYMYLSALGLSEIKIDISGLTQWYNSDSIKDVAFHRAELILPVAQINSQEYNFPASISVCYKKNGSLVYIDDQIASDNWLGNKYDANIKAYRLDMTSYLQNIATGKYENNGIYLVPDPRISSAARVVLCSPANADPDKRPKLNILYSHPGN